MAIAQSTQPAQVSQKTAALALTSLTPIGYTKTGLPLVKFGGKNYVLNDWLKRQVAQAQLQVAAAKRGQKVSKSTAIKLTKFGISPFEPDWRGTLKAKETSYKEKRARRKEKLEKLAQKPPTLEALRKVYPEATQQDIKDWGLYQVYDYDANQFVPTIKTVYKEREKFYRAVPEAGPPGTPGKVTPTVATARRKAEYQKQLKELKAFEASHIKLKDSKGEDVWLPIKSAKDKEGNIVEGKLGWNDWPEQYQAIALRENFDKAMKTQDEDLVKFKAENTRLADNTWIPNEEWAKMPSKYQDIGKQKGFEAMLATIKEDESRGTIAGNLERAKQVSGWLNKVKVFLGLTPDDITEAQARFLTTPPMPEADKKTPGLSARQMLSVLVPTLAERPVETKKASFSEVLRAVVEAEKKKIELGTIGMGLSISHLAPDLMGKLKTFAEPLPAGLEQAIKFGGGLTLGAFSAPIYSAIVTGHLAQVTWAPNKVGKLIDLGKGIADFFISIPPTIAAEPALATGFYTGLFVVGPEGMAKILKATGARGVPSYIPIRGMGIEYSVVRVPTKIASKSAVITATNQAIARAMRNKSGTATVRIGDGLVKLKIKSTPISEVVGPALYHATPALVDALKKGQIKGTLYTSPHLAVRFAESSAKGTPQASPAILMIFPKKGKVKWSPTTNLYKGTKEMEAIYGTTKLERVKSLWARLTFDKLGDFITVYKGEIIPIYRFKEPGATAPRIGLSDLMAIRLRATIAGLTDLVKGKKGYEIIKETSKEAGRVEIELLIKPHEYMLRTLKRLYRSNPRELERLYRANPEVFERAYLEQLNREIERIIREKPFVAGERFTEVERRQVERGIIPERLRRLIPREERFTEQIIRLRPPVERRPPERVPPRKVPPERLLRRRLPIEEIPKRLPPVLVQARDEARRQKDYKGAVAWQQGALLRKGKLVPIWKVWKRPYEQKDLETVFEDELPVGVKTVKGIKSAYATIQQFRGKVAPRETQEADIGAFIATVSKPTPKPGGAGEIKFTRDLSSKVRGEKSGAWKRLPLHTTIEQLIAIVFKKSETEVGELSEGELGSLEMEEVVKERPSAKVKFAKRELADKLEKVTPAETARIITKTNLTSAQKKELLRMMPDRERQQVELILSNPEMFAPTRGTPKATYQPRHLRRKKVKTKKVKSEPMLIGARL